MTLKPRTIGILEAAGWSTNRAIEMASFVAVLESNQFVVSPAVKQFLLTYGALQIEYRYDESDESARMDKLLIDPCVALDNTHLERIQNYSQRAGKQLCPIGLYNWNHDTLFMSEDGMVYGGSSIYLDRIGNSGEDAINNILTGKQMWFEQIP